ncbi:archaeoflavoprotein AfpA [Archaeoglobus sulfaticallidus PM70-1]|uniref:Archaeoflavoprotein AfpA n=1 Tax=Archaeoglobus sulfaticallidus PM70-1 TaxID=387631 RepID=N0BE28_9EURY|nr:archaeoflavoprotein AfpA [Archaeoglobus sulfaticallidus]AGK61268.1 archaeoflavoprotein AfpA [Archaeoglobus sulfaticallidus PM70-1]
MEEIEEKTMRVAWGITGAGDRLEEILAIMKEINSKYDDLEIRVYLSKAGEQVMKFYRIYNDLKSSFEKVYVEKNANSPFLAGQIQTGKFEFMIIAPATANTTAKISLGIADTLLTNSALMGLKAYVPLYILPTDYKAGEVLTKLPNGKLLKIRVRKEDVEHVERLRKMDGIFVLESPQEIPPVFEKHYRLLRKD